MNVACSKCPRRTAMKTRYYIRDRNIWVKLDKFGFMYHDYSKSVTSEVYDKLKNSTWLIHNEDSITGS